MDTPTYTITYVGAWLSLNAVYSSHRWQRSKVKNEWKERFEQMLTKAQIPALPAFKLHIRYNSRMDCDNLTAGTKVLCDTMRSLGIVADDTKHYYQGITIEPDLALDHNTYVVTILPQTPAQPLVKPQRKSITK